MRMKVTCEKTYKSGRSSRHEKFCEGERRDPDLCQILCLPKAEGDTDRFKGDRGLSDGPSQALVQELVVVVARVGPA